MPLYCDDHVYASLVSRLDEKLHGDARFQLCVASLPEYAVSNQDFSGRV